MELLNGVRAVLSSLAFVVLVGASPDSRGPSLAAGDLYKSEIWVWDGPMRFRIITS